MTPQSRRIGRRGGACHAGTQNPGVPVRHGVPAADPRRIRELRRELAEAERALRARAQQAAERLQRAERDACREACDACHAYDRIRPSASARLDAIRAGGRERFHGEEKFAEMALRQADRADAAYTVIAFAHRRDRLRYLRGGTEREAVIREALTRGGVFTEACGGQYFQEIVR